MNLVIFKFLINEKSRSKDYPLLLRLLLLVSTKDSPNGQPPFSIALPVH